MKILVGVLYCIENEISQCISSIKQQIYQDYDYFIIEGLPNKEAHNKLYETFMKNNKDYDLFIKIDADMVLSRPTFFSEVVDYITKENDIDDLQIAVNDCFTDRLIYGLHVYNGRMQWEKDHEQIFVDWPDKIRSYKRVNDNEKLAPAADHCPNPGKYQAFHFGLHKVVKITQYDREELRYFACLVHWDNILKLAEHFNNDKENISLAFALLGVYEGITGKLMARHVDFDNPESVLLFRKWEEKDDSEVLRGALKIVKLLSFIPQNLLLQLILLPRNIRGGGWGAFSEFINNMANNRLRNYQKNNNMKMRVLNDEVC
jgi:hypothetical protein